MSNLDALIRTYGRGPAFRGWASHVWDAGGLHGAKLAEALGAPQGDRPGDIDCVPTADRILAALEIGGWIVRGKMELTPTRRALGKGHAGAAYPIDHFWMPNRKSADFFDWLFPDMDDATRAECARHYGFPQREPKGPPMLKITITRAALFAALSACAEVTPTRPVRPALACVLLDASRAGLSLFAQGNNEALWSDAMTIAHEPGRVLVHARDLLRRIDALPDGEIEIREMPAKGSEAGKLQIKQGTTRATLSLLAIDEAPAVAKPEPSGEAIPGHTLATLLSRLAPSMGGETQPTIYGVRLIGKGGKMLGAATNGHTLAFASCVFDGAIDTMVPAPAVAHLRRLLGKMDAEVRLAAKGPALHVFGPGFVYTTQLASEGYPEAVLYSQIPKRGEHRAIVNREEFIAAIEFARIADPEGYLRIRPSPGALTLRGEGANGAGARTIVADTTIQSCTFDAGYMLRGAGLFSGESIELWVEPGNRVVDGAPEALCIREPGNDDVFVCMSIKYTAADLTPDADEAAA